DQRVVGVRDHRVRGIKDAEQGFPHGELRKEVDLIDGLPAHFTVDEDVPAASLNLLIEEPQKKACLSAALPSKDDQEFQIVVIGSAHVFVWRRESETKAGWKEFLS